MEDYFVQLADELEKNPLLSVDYLRRAHLFAGNSDHRERVKQIVDDAEISGRAKKQRVDALGQVLACFRGPYRTPKTQCNNIHLVSEFSGIATVCRSTAKKAKEADQGTCKCSNIRRLSIHKIRRSISVIKAENVHSHQ